MPPEEVDALSGLPTPGWTGGQLRRLGDAIRLNLTAPGAGPSYDDVVAHYDDLGACVLSVLDGLDWESLLTGREVQLTSRAKTIDTLRDKLLRDPNTPLGNIQDVAGVRFEAEMTLEEQDVVASAIAQAFGHDPTLCVRDMREAPHSGYRAVHVWLRLPSGRVEVQVRTHIQGAWANAYEGLADVVGRFIRYDNALPDDPNQRLLVTAMRDAVSSRGRELELTKQEIATARLNGKDVPADLVKRHQLAEKNYTDVTRTLHENFKLMRLG